MKAPVKQHSKDLIIWSSVLGSFAIAALCYSSIVMYAQTGTHAVAASAETKSAPPGPPPIPSMAEILASPDLLTAMGQVYMRDSYHIGEKLKRDGYPKSPPKLDLVEVDERLTAEQVFAVNGKGPNIGLFSIGAPPSPPDARRLSRPEILRLWGLYRIYSMASLALYKKRCGYTPSLELNVITSQFTELPQKQQDSALDYETTAIDARGPYDDAKSQIHIPGGWKWFCSVVHDHIVSHYFFEEMFTTAMEMRR